MNELDLLAFIDESCKPVRDRATRRPVEDGRHYVAAAATTFVGDLEMLRAELAAITEMLGRPLHYRTLSVKQRQQAIEAVTSIAGWDGHVYETAHPFRKRTNEHHVRAKLVEASLIALSRQHGATAIIFETRNEPVKGFEGLDEKDRQVLRRLLQRELVPSELRIRHETKTETVLALSDLIARAHGSPVRSRHSAVRDDQSSGPDHHAHRSRVSRKTQRPRDCEPQPVRGLLPLRPPPRRWESVAEFIIGHDNRQHKPERQLLSIRARIAHQG